MKTRNILFGALLPVLVSFALCQQLQAAGDTPDPGAVANTNTADGLNALGNDTSGFGNSGFGWFAGWDNIAGNFNTAVGAAALDLNSGFDENTAVGAAAMLLSQGEKNTAVGAAALENNNSTENTAIGDFALFSNFTAQGNTGVGQRALLGTTVGSFNTGVGLFVMPNNIDGATNTVMGAVAGLNLIHGGFNTYVGDLVGAGAPDESSVIRIADPSTGFAMNACFIGGIGTFNQPPIAGSIETVTVDLSTGQLGWFHDTAPIAAAQKIQEQEATIAELKSEMKILVARIEEQDAKIQKVSAQIEMVKPAPQVVVNKP